MLTKYLIPGIALIGLVCAVLFVRAGGKPVPASQPVAQPAQAPFAAYLAGAGIIESSTENIAVGTVVPGVVLEVYAKVGDAVKVGQPLFRIDDRDLQAELVVKKATVETARARVQVEQALLADLRNQLEMWSSVNDARAISKQELDTKRFAVATGEARLAQAAAELKAADAGVLATQTLIDRTIARSPINGQVLQVKVRVGEFAPTGVLPTALMLLGEVTTLNVRVDIDENDAWRLKPNARARAFIRGNRDLATDLRFVRVEPYVVPKRSLTGESTERVDTRVLQVLYSFPAGAIPAYVGQQMDVFIEADPIGNAPAATMGSAADREGK